MMGRGPIDRPVERVSDLVDAIADMLAGRLSVRGPDFSVGTERVLVVSAEPLSDRIILEVVDPYDFDTYHREPVDAFTIHITRRP